MIVFEKENPGSCVHDRMMGSEATDLASGWGASQKSQRSALGRLLGKGKENYKYTRWGRDSL